MTRQVRGLIFAAVALAVVAAAGWLLLRQDAQVPQTPQKQERALGDGAVEQVRISGAQGAYVLAPQGVDVLPEGLAADELTELTLEALASFSVGESIDAAQDEALYGLDAPAVEASVLYASGQTLRLQLGAQESVSGDFYCRFDGEEAIYLLDQGVASRLLLAPEDYISLQITPACRTQSSLSAVLDLLLRTPQGEISVRSCADPDEATRLEMLSFGAVTHLVDGPGVVHEMDRTYGQEIFDSLFNLCATEVVAYGLDEDGLAQLGFDQPDATAAFSLRNGEEADTPVEDWVVRVVFEEEEGALIAVNDEGVVYRAPRPAFAGAQYERLVMRWFVSPLLTDVEELAVCIGDREYVYKIGGTAAQPQITREGEAVDLARFRSFYTLVVSCAGNGDYLGLVQPQGEPVLRLRYRYKDDQKADDVLEMYEIDARTLLVSVNSVAEFAMRRNYLDVLAQAVDALETGGEIAQTW